MTIVPDLMQTALVVLLFVAFFAGVCALISYAGGWYALSKTYPRPRGERPLRRRWLASARIGSAYYQASLIVGVNVGGLFLSCLPPFNVAAPPIYIPWTALRFVGRWNVLWIKHLRLQTQTGISIELLGMAADLADRAGPWPP